MVGYSGDDLTVFLALLALGIPFGWEAVKERGWRRIVAGALAALFIGAAFSWGEIKNLAPKFAAKVVAFATNDETWFFLFLFIAAIFFLSSPALRRLREGEKQPPGGLPNQPKLIDGGDYSAEGQTDFPARIEAQLVGITGNLKSVWEKLNFLVTRVEGLEGFTAKLETEWNGTKSEISGLRTAILKAIPIEVQKALAKIVEAQEEIGTKVDGLSQEISHAECDLTHLFRFAVNSVTLRYLDRIYGENPFPRCKNIALYPNEREREVRQRELQKYVNDVLGWLRDTKWGAQAADITKNAQAEIESNLRKTPSHQRPAEVDPYIAQDYLIAENQCVKLETFLGMIRADVAAELTASRDSLLQRQEGLAANKTFSPT